MASGNYCSLFSDRKCFRHTPGSLLIWKGSSNGESSEIKWEHPEKSSNEDTERGETIARPTQAEMEGNQADWTQGWDPDPADTGVLTVNPPHTHQRKNNEGTDCEMKERAQEPAEKRRKRQLNPSVSHMPKWLRDLTGRYYMQRWCGPMRPSWTEHYLKGSLDKILSCVTFSVNKSPVI